MERKKSEKFFELAIALECPEWIRKTEIFRFANVAAFNLTSFTFEIDKCDLFYSDLILPHYNLVSLLC